MKLTNINAVMGRKVAGSRRESTDAKKARIAVEMATMGFAVYLGQLLAARTEDGRTGAQTLKDGGVLDFGSFDFAGIKVAPENAKISLQAVPEWGCPTCRSVTGSGYAQSNAGVNVDNLAGVNFFLNPRTNRLFTISPSCWDKYFAVEHSSRFISMADYAERLKKAQSSQADVKKGAKS